MQETVHTPIQVASTSTTFIHHPLSHPRPAIEIRDPEPFRLKVSLYFADMSSSTTASPSSSSCVDGSAGDAGALVRALRFSLLKQEENVRSVRSMKEQLIRAATSAKLLHQLHSFDASLIDELRTDLAASRLQESLARKKCVDVEREVEELRSQIEPLKATVIRLQSELDAALSSHDRSVPFLADQEVNAMLYSPTKTAHPSSSSFSSSSRILHSSSMPAASYEQWRMQEFVANYAEPIKRDILQERPSNNSKSNEDFYLLRQAFQDNSPEDLIFVTKPTAALKDLETSRQRLASKSLYLRPTTSSSGKALLASSSSGTGGGGRRRHPLPHLAVPSLAEEQGEQSPRSASSSSRGAGRSTYSRPQTVAF